MTHRDVTRAVTRRTREEKKTLEQINPPLVPQEQRSGAGGFLNKKVQEETICQAINAQGVTDVNASDPRLASYVACGVPVERFENAAHLSAKAGKGASYMFGILNRELKEAADVAAGPRMLTEPWHERRSGVEAMAAQHGLLPWDQDAFNCGNGESYPAYLNRVRQQVESQEMAIA